MNQIFESVTDIIVDDDLKQAQQQFFDQHSSKFEDSEENKHEYHQIFKEYTNIIDKALESKLLEQYDETLVEQFFDTFETNYKNYQNQDTIDNLFTFLDFENFKKTMIDYNKRIQNQEKKNYQNPEIKINYSNETKRAQETFQKYSPKDISQWKKLYKSKQEKDGFLEIRSLPYNNTGIDMLLMQWQLKDFQLETIIKACFEPDVEYWKQNMKELKEGSLLPVSNTENVLHIVVQLPMMSKREFLFSNKIIKKEKQVIIQNDSIDLPQFPLRKECIRVESHKICYIDILGDNKYQITVMQYQDLKGYIPKMFLNMMMTTMGKDEVSKFQENLKLMEQRSQQQK